MSVRAPLRAVDRSGTVHCAYVHKLLLRAYDRSGRALCTVHTCTYCSKLLIEVVVRLENSHLRRSSSTRTYQKHSPSNSYRSAPQIQRLKQCTKYTSTQLQTTHLYTKTYQRHLPPYFYPTAHKNALYSNNKLVKVYCTAVALT